MSSEKFKVSGVGIDTSNLVNISLSKEDDWKYIYTSLSECNTYLVKEAITTETILVTSADFINGVTEAIEYHISDLGASQINLLLFPEDKDFSKYPDILRNLIESGKVHNIGISYTTGKHIKEAYDQLKKIGITVEYLGMDICPYQFDYDIISWAKENKINIVGFNPFGGHRSSGYMIESFTAGYLLGFISTYASIVFLSSRNLSISLDSRDYIRTLFGKDVTPKYILRKNIFKLIKPFGQIITTDLVFKEDLILPIDMPEYLYSLDETRISFGQLEPVYDNAIANFNTNRIEEEVISMVNLLIKPEDCSDLGFLSIIFPKVNRYLKEQYPASPLYISKLGKNLFFILCTKETVTKTHWWSRAKILRESEGYILYYKNDKFIFQKYENTLKEAQNSNI